MYIEKNVYFVSHNVMDLRGNFVVRFGKIAMCCIFDSGYAWVGKIPWRRDRLPTPVFLGFPSCSEGKESTCNVGDLW